MRLNRQCRIGEHQHECLLNPLEGEAFVTLDLLVPLTLGQIADAQNRQLVIMRKEKSAVSTNRGGQRNLDHAVKIRQRGICQLRDTVLNHDTAHVI